MFLRESETSLPHAHAWTYAAHMHAILGETVIVRANLHFSSNEFLSGGLILLSLQTSGRERNIVHEIKD